ncbi:hypothetical protein IAD21_03593 [Abditibacteriota bacterium]|nr:hypothetical protein IAD21_03593 [Abditibacteriota bacterium]
MKKSLIILAALFLVFLILNPFVTVPAGHRAVLFSLSGGTQNRQLGEGVHFVFPFLQSAIFYDVRSQTYTMSARSWEGEVKGDDSLTALTSDGQALQVELSVRFHPDPNRVARLHQRVGPDYANKIIRPAARSQTRVAFAEYPVSVAYSEKREVIEKRIADGLRQSLGQNDLILDEVLLRDITFSPAYAKAVEAKQIAQQNSQRMNYVLQRAQIQKQITVLNAEGDARSIQLRGQAIKQNTRVIEYEYARKIAPNVSAIITDGRSNLPFTAPKP